MKKLLKKIKAKLTARRTRRKEAEHRAMQARKWNAVRNSPGNIEL